MEKTNLRSIKNCLYKEFTENEIESGIRVKNRLYYSTGIYGINGIIFEGTDGEIYKVSKRNSILFMVV